MLNRRGYKAILSGGTLALQLTIGTASAKPKDAALPPTMLKLSDCRTIANDTQRLACFDREVAALDSEIRAKQVAVVDRADVRKTRRTLFGIPLPEIKLFSNDDEPQIKEITAVITSINRTADGRIAFTLDDGAVWAQTDDFPVYSAVKAGQKVTLKRGAFGSFFADFVKAASVRAKRVR